MSKLGEQPENPLIGLLSLCGIHSSLASRLSQLVPEALEGAAVSVLNMEVRMFLKLGEIKNATWKMQKVL